MFETYLWKRRKSDVDKEDDVTRRLRLLRYILSKLRLIYANRRFGTGEVVDMKCWYVFLLTVFEEGHDSKNIVAERPFHFVLTSAVKEYN